MKQSKKILPSLVMGVCVGVFSQFSSAAVLSSDPSLNIDLGVGSYEFAGTHLAGVNVFDVFEFSVDDPSNITASIYNLSVPQQDPSATPLLNIGLLTLGLFDSLGNFVAASGSGGILSADNLAAGSTYTLSVFGKANGVFGGAYHGDLQVVETPLPAALPAFISALLALGARRRKVAAQ